MPNNQGSVKNIYSNSNSFYYLEQAFYNAAGRLEQADLGAQYLGNYPVLRNAPSYYAWNITNLAERMSSNVTTQIKTTSAIR